MAASAMALLTSCAPVRSTSADTTTRLRENAPICLQFSAAKTLEYMAYNGDMSGIEAMTEGDFRKCFFTDARPQYSIAGKPIGDVQPIILHTLKGPVHAYTLYPYTR